MTRFLFSLFLLLLIKSSIAQKAEMAIYPLLNFGSDTNTRGFVPLTESYIWNEHPDSQAIAKDYLGEEPVEENSNNYHVLDAKHRSQFLKTANIKEQDFIFIYNLTLDTLISFRVKDVPIVAFINIYGASMPVIQYDYMIGFEIANLALHGMDPHYSNTFVYVGKRSPFVKGGMAPMRFTVIEAKDFPATATMTLDSSHDVPTEEIQNLTYSYGGYQYFVRDYGFVARHIVVLDAKNKLVFENIYYDSEGGSLAPLCQAGENFDYCEQWAGELFKNQPPVFTGFMYTSFGCPSIPFIDPKLTPIYIRCDNRH